MWAGGLEEGFDQVQAGGGEACIGWAQCVGMGGVGRASDGDRGIRLPSRRDEQKWALRKHMREAQVG